MLRALDRNAERWALLFFYILLVTTMVVEVIRREVLSYSSIWGEELVRYSFIYLVWIGASAAIKDRAHIRIDVIFHALPHQRADAAVSVGRPDHAGGGGWPSSSGRGTRSTPLCGLGPLLTGCACRRSISCWRYR